MAFFVPFHYDMLNEVFVWFDNLAAFILHSERD